MVGQITGSNSSDREGEGMKLKRLMTLLGFIALVGLIAWAGHQFTAVSVSNWYVGIKKASWTPPAWVFGPVWFLLYLSIAISGWLIQTKIRSSSSKRLSLIVYGGQLLVNGLWPYFFFFLKSPLLGLIDILLLTCLIAINIRVFTRLYKPAGLLLIPYFLWTLYALTLNWATWELNR